MACTIQMRKIYYFTFVVILLFVFNFYITHRKSCSSIEVDSDKLIKNSPFYSFLTSHFGKEISCEYTKEDDVETIIYHFPRNMTFEIRNSENAEYALYRITVKNIGYPKAISLLKEESTDFLGGEDCGIRWEKFKIEKNKDGSFDRVWEGNVCNCKARMHYENNILNEIIFHAVC